MKNKLIREKVEVIEGDITQQRVDAIVNAANEALITGGGVSGAIHRAAGLGLEEECLKLGGCNEGEAKITKGYNLPAKWVIHTVGPVWEGGSYGEDKVLANCYRNCLSFVEAYQIKTIAFPAISTGVGDKSVLEADEMVARAMKIPAGVSQGIAAPIESANSISSQESFPWSGEITGAPSVALNENYPLDVRQANTIADLKQGTPVLVIGRVVNEKQKNWLRVEVLDDSERSGYVSGELVKRREQLTEIELRRSFILLKKAETASANNGALPSEGEIAWAQNRLRLVRNYDLDGVSRYKVNPETHQVSFNQSNKEQIKVINITDFILFVEAVERQYPHAKPGAVASEIREIWFADENWKLLSAGTGISTSVGMPRGVTRSVDIESKPNPIAVMFDTGEALSGKEGARPKLIVTRLGMTDITHVMAGIDVAINGMAEKPNVLDPRGRAKYQILEEASGGNTHDFATWSGDLGQAYGDYLRRLYVLQETWLKLGIVFADKANPEALRGDIHGYIAALVSQEMQQDGSSPTNNQPQRVSDILRNLYLVERPNSAQRRSYRYYFEKVAGKAGLELYNFILDRTIRFAKPWYAKDLYNALNEPLTGENETAFKKRVLAIRSRLDVEVTSSGLGNVNAVNVINKLIEDFDYKHKKNEQLAEENNKIGEYVNGFIKMIDSEVSI